MYILIDMEIDAVELAEPQDTHRFHIAVVNGEDDAKVDEVLSAKGCGRLDPDDDEHAWVPAAFVREMAEGRVHGLWAEGFDHMLEKGAKHGWYNADTDEIKAHVEWIDSADGMND